MISLGAAGRIVYPTTDVPSGSVSAALALPRLLLRCFSLLSGISFIFAIVSRTTRQSVVDDSRPLWHEPSRSRTPINILNIYKEVDSKVTRR